jgi:flagellar protein FlgJ
MSIFPATDIITDVARAADPEKLRIATKRLEDIGGQKAFGVGHAFALLPPAALHATSTRSVATNDIGAPRLGGRLETLSATQKFEAFLLQGWLENILPKSGGGAYGTEAGADIWRSMMAEQISYQLARADVAGLRKLIEAENSPLSKPI